MMDIMRESINLLIFSLASSSIYFTLKRDVNMRGVFLRCRSTPHYDPGVSNSITNRCTRHNIAEPVPAQVEAGEKCGKG